MTADQFETFANEIEAPPTQSALAALLDDLRARAKTEREKGTYFEELVVAYLRTEPMYRERYAEVMTWVDWAKRNGRDGRDVGIDPLCVREVVASPEPRSAAFMKQGGEERRHRERVLGSVQTEAGAAHADAERAERQQAEPGNGRQPTDAVALAA